MIVEHDSGSDIIFVPSSTMEGKPTSTEIERTDARHLEMDPDAYEVAEGIAELFDSLDQNRDNQVTFEEFLEGAKRHPELLDLFVKSDDLLGPVPDELQAAMSV